MPDHPSGIGYAKTFYPSRPLSRLIALKNLWLPFHNRGFAALVGFVYFFYAWVFHTSAPPTLASRSVVPAADAAAVARAAEANPVFFFMLLGLWVGLVVYVDARLSNRFLKWLNGTVKVVLGSVHFLFHMMALLYVAAITTALTTKVFNPVIGTIVLHSKVFLGEFFDAEAEAWIARRIASPVSTGPVRQHGSVSRVGTTSSISLQRRCRTLQFPS